MPANGDPQPNPPSFALIARVCTALWGRVGPEGPVCFQTS